MQLLDQCPLCNSPRIIPYAMKYMPGFKHLVDPVAYLKELQRVLKPGGILIIGTPDISSFAHRVYRVVNFASLRVPVIIDGLEHTVVFNKKRWRH